MSQYKGMAGEYKAWRERIKWNALGYFFYGENWEKYRPIVEAKWNRIAHDKK